LELFLISALTRFVQVTDPLHFSAESADSGLPVNLDQHAKRGFNRRAFGACAGGAHGLTHQLIIDFDIGSQGENLDV